MRNKSLWAVWILYIFLIGLLVGIDLLSKHFVFKHITESGNDITLIKGVLVFNKTHNTGASFGMFGENTKILSYFSLILASGLTVVLMFLANSRTPLLNTSLIFIIAGGFGNCVDRFMFGYVRDFIYFEIIDWYVFNAADAFLFIGTALLIIYILFGFKSQDKGNNVKSNSLSK